MIDFSKISKFVIVTGATDLRKGIDGYVAIIQEHYQLNPFEECMFLFCNRHHDKLKCLCWDKNGFWLLYKRLEKGTFKWKLSKAGAIDITYRQLMWLLEGLKMEQTNAFENLNYAYG